MRDTCGTVCVCVCVSHKVVATMYTAGVYTASMCSLVVGGGLRPIRFEHSSHVVEVLIPAAQSFYAPRRSNIAKSSDMLNHCNHSSH